MTDKYARELSEKISNEEIYSMLKRASNEVINWTKPSKANLGISRGANWNMFCKDFDLKENYSSIRKYRMIQEFGDYLDDKFKAPKKPKREIKTTHFDPDFINFK